MPDRKDEAPSRKPKKTAKKSVPKQNVDEVIEQVRKKALDPTGESGNILDEEA